MTADDDDRAAPHAPFCAEADLVASAYRRPRMILPPVGAAPGSPHPERDRRSNDQTRTIGSAFATQDNNFDVLRLGAALLVIFSHSYPLTKTTPEPVMAWFGGYVEGGGLGVATFFAISGFLVTRSLERHDLRGYVASRFLRIMPALAVVAVVQTFLIGAWFTTLPLADYLVHPGTLDGLRNILVFDVRYTLPGVFAGNPYPGAVNGSLWTLPVESFFYLLLPLLFLLGLLRRRRIVVFLGLLFLLFLVGSEVYGYSRFHQGGIVFGSVPFYPALTASLDFVMGAVLWVHRDDVPLNWGMAACGVIALFAAAHTLSADYVFNLVFPYLVLYAALARPLATSWTGRIGDLSYGTYLFAFPIQQSIVALLGPGLGPLRLTLLAIPATLVCAALSWRLVERPSLRLKRAWMRPEEARRLPEKGRRSAARPDEMRADGVTRADRVGVADAPLP